MASVIAVGSGRDSFWLLYTFSAKLVFSWFQALGSVKLWLVARHCGSKGMLPAWVGQLQGSAAATVVDRELGQ